MVDNETALKILDDYRSSFSLYQDLASSGRGLLNTILAAEGLQLHSITSRAKLPESLELKLARPDRDYAAIGDVTDLAGIRITTYFEDDVDVVSKIIEREFTIDRANSVDRRKALDPDRFGYVSVHYVVSLDARRRSLAEYTRYGDTRFEIQVRSILQHAWAEIEHDLGYKLKESVPRDIRRRFSRLAGLLELADEEFASIRDALSEYRTGLAEQIESRPSTVELDKDSLVAFITTSALLQGIDGSIAKVVGGKIAGGPLLVERNVSRLKQLGIHTVDDLQRALETHAEVVLAFAAAWMKGSHHDTLQPGIALFYLGYVLVSQSADYERILEYLTTFDISEKEKRPEIARQVLDTARTLDRAGGS